MPVFTVPLTPELAWALILLLAVLLLPFIIPAVGIAFLVFVVWWLSGWWGVSALGLLMGAPSMSFARSCGSALPLSASCCAVSSTPGLASANYIPNDWREQPNGQNYIGEIRRTGRPDVQRAAAELLATLGPRISQIEEDFAQRYGWTNRDPRIIQRHAGALDWVEPWFR